MKQTDILTAWVTHDPDDPAQEKKVSFVFSDKGLTVDLGLYLLGRVFETLSNHALRQGVPVRVPLTVLGQVESALTAASIDAQVQARLLALAQADDETPISDPVPDVDEGETKDGLPVLEVDAVKSAEVVEVPNDGRRLVDEGEGE